MPLRRWFFLIGMLVGLGCLRVAQRNALMVTGYAVGDSRARIHAKQTEVSWADARVEGLASPVHLAEVAQERRLKLVAWSTLPNDTAPPTSLAAFNTQVAELLDAD